MTSQAMAAALVAAVAAVATAGCGGGGAARPTTTAAPAVSPRAPGPAVSPRAPAPAGYRFRSPHRYGYWFTRPPVVVVPKIGDFQHTVQLFFRLNRRLPRYRARDGRLTQRIDADATVNGAYLYHGSMGAVGAPRPCYATTLNANVRQADDVAVGELVTVRLHIGDHRQALTVRVPLGVASGTDNDPLDQVYLSRIGCAGD